MFPNAAASDPSHFPPHLLTTALPAGAPGSARPATADTPWPVPARVENRLTGLADALDPPPPPPAHVANRSPFMTERTAPTWRPPRRAPAPVELSWSLVGYAHRLLRDVVVALHQDPATRMADASVLLGIPPDQDALNNQLSALIARIDDLSRSVPAPAWPPSGTEDVITHTRLYALLRQELEEMGYLRTRTCLLRDTIADDIAALGDFARRQPEQAARNVDSMLAFILSAYHQASAPYDHAAVPQAAEDPSMRRPHSPQARQLHDVIRLFRVIHGFDETLTLTELMTSPDLLRRHFGALIEEASRPSACLADADGALAPFRTLGQDVARTVALQLMQTLDVLLEPCEQLPPARVAVAAEAIAFALCDSGVLEQVLPWRGTEALRGCAYILCSTLAEKLTRAGAWTRIDCKEVQVEDRSGQLWQLPLKDAMQVKPRIGTLRSPLTLSRPDPRFVEAAVDAHTVEQLMLFADAHAARAGQSSSRQPSSRQSTSRQSTSTVLPRAGHAPTHSFPPDAGRPGPAHASGTPAIGRIPERVLERAIPQHAPMDLSPIRTGHEGRAHAHQTQSPSIRE